MLDIDKKSELIAIVVGTRKKFQNWYANFYSVEIGCAEKRRSGMQPRNVIENSFTSFC